MQCLPNFALTGNDAVDSDMKAARKIMKTVFAAVIEDPSSVLSLQDLLVSRRRAKASAAMEAALHPPMPSVADISSDIMCAALAQISDFHVDDITSCKELDTEVVKHFLGVRYWHVNEFEAS